MPVLRGVVVVQSDGGVDVSLEPVWFDRHTCDVAVVAVVWRSGIQQAREAHRSFVHIRTKPMRVCIASLALFFRRPAVILLRNSSRKIRFSGSSSDPVPRIQLS